MAGALRHAVLRGPACLNGRRGILVIAMSPWIRLLIYLVGAPVLGCVLAGWDRRISARTQSRRGPPILQPFYDVLKLWQKENLVVRRSQNFYIFFFLLQIG